MIFDRITDGIDAALDRATSPFRDPVIRLGVTGLSRAGKTVFITSLVANLMDRGRMPQLLAANGAIHTAYLQPQPDDTLPRFRYEDHITALTAPNPHWPEGTNKISQLRLSLRVQPSGALAGVQGMRTVHLDIIDYPGEWLLDLGLLDLSYPQWSDRVLARIATRPEAADYLTQVTDTDPGAPLDEPKAQALAEGFTAYLHAARKAGWADLTPGRFLLPGDMAGSPVLTFAPLPVGEGRRSLYAEFDRRFESYKRNVVQPFFRDHFARIDRQVVLVDVLGALDTGPQAVEALRETMTDILTAFRPGRNPWLVRWLRGRRVDKILFAATKADHIHHTQHARLAEITQALLRQAKDRADFAGAETRAMSIAALRATTEETLDHEGRETHVVRGRLADGSHVALHPGDLPDDPNAVLAAARAGTSWPGAGYRVTPFAPAPLSLKPGEGPPHIRLDKAAQFLIGDRL